MIIWCFLCRIVNHLGIVLCWIINKLWATWRTIILNQFNLLSLIRLAKHSCEVALRLRIKCLLVLHFCNFLCCFLVSGIKHKVFNHIFRIIFIKSWVNTCWIDFIMFSVSSELLTFKQLVCALLKLECEIYLFVPCRLVRYKHRFL